MKNDFVFYSNLLDDKSKKEFRIAQGIPIDNSFYKPLFLNYNKDIIGSLIALDTLPEDTLSRQGIIKARKQFLQALKYSTENLDVKIVLLAASTKRLFGKEIELKVNWDGQLDDTGFTLRELYPEILFTNGDNGTAAILDMEVDAILEKIHLSPENIDSCKFLNYDHTCSGSIIINGLGLLGTNTLKHLINNQFCEYQVIVISNHTKELDEIIGKSNVRVFSNISEIENHCCMGFKNNIKLIVNCTHHPNQMITSNSIQHIQNGQSIHVIDVAVPYGFPEEEYLKCKNVSRQDGGNAYIEKGLEFFFNPEICGLTENVLYGCFAETVAISAYLKENPEEIENISKLDLFNVNKTSKNFVKGLFKKYGIGVAEVPFSFNKRNSELIL